VTSGVRLGTAALSTRGMGTVEMEQVAGFIEKILSGSDDPARLAVVRSEIASLCARLPVFA